MAGDGSVRVEAAWFTPARLLLLFCLMSLLIYLDRGTMSSAAVSGNPGGDAPGSPPPSGLQGEFGISYYQYGWLQAAFMIGLLCGSPVFSALAKRANPFRLIAVTTLEPSISRTGSIIDFPIAIAIFKKN